jgi:hypothetical protein
MTLRFTNLIRRLLLRPVLAFAPALISCMAGTPASSAVPPDQQLMQDIRTVQEILERESIPRPDTDRLADAVLNAILKEAGLNNALNMAFPPPENVKLPHFQWRKISDSVSYCVPGRIHAGVLRQISDKLNEFTPDVLLLDIRYPGGDDFSAIDSSNITLDKARTSALIVLINSKTSQSTELLANVLTQIPRTVLVGHSSSGTPVPLTAHPVNNHTTVYLPNAVFSRFFDSWPPTALTPDVAVPETLKETTPPVLVTDSLAISQDPALQKALDLATAIVAFQSHAQPNDNQ